MPALSLSHFDLLCRLNLSFFPLWNSDMQDAVHISRSYFIAFNFALRQRKASLEGLIAEFSSAVAIIRSVLLALFFALGSNGKHIVVEFHFKVIPLHPWSCDFNLEIIIGFPNIHSRK